MMHIDAPPTVPRAIQTPSRFFPAVPPPFRSTPPQAVPNLPPPFSAASYRGAIGRDDPAGFERWVDLLTPSDWDRVARGLNGLLPTRLCLAPERLNEQFKAAAEQLSPVAQAWCRRAVLLAREPIGWHDVRTERRFQVQLIVRALRGMATFVDHFAPVVSRTGTVWQELSDGQVFDAGTLLTMKSEVAQQSDGARAWAELPEEALRVFEPLRTVRVPLANVSVEAVYAVYDALDEKLPWLTDNYGQSDPRVRRWWRRWASSPPRPHGRWISSFDELADLQGHASGLATAVRAWAPDSRDCLEATTILSEPKNSVRRATPCGGPGRWLDVGAVHAALSRLAEEYGSVLRAFGSGGLRLGG